MTGEDYLEEDSLEAEEEDYEEEFDGQLDKYGEILKELLDFRKFVEYGLLKIVDKNKNLVTFKMNKAQEHILDVIEDLQRRHKPVRIIVLKARQLGVSTFFEMYFCHKGAFTQNTNIVIVGHEDGASQNLFDMTKRAVVELPDEIRPERKRTNSKEITFSKLNSQIKVLTANGRDKVGRSGNPNYAHLTEVGFWADAEKTMLALLQSVPDTPNSFIAIESTANGVGGSFYNRWKSAETGESDFVPIFFSWLMDEGYSTEFDNPQQRQHLIKTLDDEELRLIEQHGATLEQLNWRRKTIRDKCENKLDLFHQEYPTVPEEAFLTTGQPVFDIKICQEQLAKCEKPLLRGYLEPVYDLSPKFYRMLDEGHDTMMELMPYLVEVKFIENPKGYLRQFKDIVFDEGEHYRYCAGCDVAEGLQQGDFSVIKVLDRKTNEVVMTWHGHIDADLLGEQIYLLSKYLHDDLVTGIERNNQGLTTVIAANNLGVAQYYMEDYNKGVTKGTDMLGFRTTQSSKAQILNTLNGCIRDKEFTDLDSIFWGETLTFVKDAKGRMAAQNKGSDRFSKCFDDCVMAEAIMFRVNQWMPSYYRKEVVNVPSWYKRYKNKHQNKFTVMGV